MQSYRQVKHTHTYTQTHTVRLQSKERKFQLNAGWVHCENFSITIFIFLLINKTLIASTTCNKRSLKLLLMLRFFCYRSLNSSVLLAPRWIESHSKYRGIKMKCGIFLLVFFIFRATLPPGISCDAINPQMSVGNRRSLYHLLLQFSHIQHQICILMSILWMILSLNLKFVEHSNLSSVAVYHLQY